MSAKIIHPRERKIHKEFRREFSWKNDPESGFSFPIENGQVVLDNEDAKHNYNYCLTHSTEIEDNGVQEVKWTYTEDAIAECEDCGTEFSLTNQYYGACQCPKCGAWYLCYDGTRCNPPDMWEEPLEEDW